MRGLITGRHVLQNVRLIWREFGAEVAVRSLCALFRRKPTTFLDVVFRTKRG